MQALFGEDAQLDDPGPIINNESLGQTTCTWSTTEGDDVMDGSGPTPEEKQAAVVEFASACATRMG